MSQVKAGQVIWRGEWIGRTDGASRPHGGKKPINHIGHVDRGS
jgi:hypothetical protein